MKHLGNPADGVPLDRVYDFVRHGSNAVSVTLGIDCP
jgi:hypothetical protein